MLQPNLAQTTRPFLLKGPEPRPHPSILVFWHLLSLDAPTVATAWTLWIAWCAGVHLPTADPLAMFLAVWLLYVADRLLDARPLSYALPSSGLEERHHFHHTHRSRFVCVALATLVPFAWLLHHLPEPEIRLYILLLCMLCAWLLLVHARSVSATSRAHRLPKELAVGIFFPAAIFIPTVARAPALRLALLPDALAFGSICTLNCLFLFLWEHPNASASGHKTTVWGVRHVQAISLFILGFCAALASTSALCPQMILLPHPRAALFTSGLSCLALLVLHAARARVQRTTLRALADFVLLTPLVAVAFQWIRPHA